MKSLKEFVWMLCAVVLLGCWLIVQTLYECAVFFAKSIVNSARNLRAK